MAEMLPPTPDTTNTRQPSLPPTASTGSFSWWSWRPGTSPMRALLVGLPLMLLAFALVVTGVYMLISGIIGTIPPSTHHIDLAGIGAIVLGLLFLPYPLFLTFGGWHDLQGQRHTISGKIIALRTTATNILRQGRSARPGVSPRLSSAWYGMALQSLEPPQQAAHQQVMVFRLTEDLYRDLREGIFVQVVYTAHLHHVTSLRQR